MNQNKKGNGWILCSSKSFPGKYYYFNVLNGETAWTLTETQVEKTKKQVQYSTIHSNYPEPKTKPPEDTPTNTTTHSQPSVTPPRPKPQVTHFGEAVFPVFLPTKDLPNFVWAPIPVKYINNTNPSYDGPNTSLVELVKEKHQPTEDDNQIVVQIHTCNDQYVSKRFVSYNKTPNSDETNLTKIKNTSSSTPSPGVQQKSYLSFDKNIQFQNNTPNNLQLTKNNKNKCIKNSSFVFQSTNSEAPTFRDVINNGFGTPKKTTFGFDTPNETTYRFDTPNETTQTFDTPNENYSCNIPYGFGIPKRTTPEYDTPGFGFHTPNETYREDTISTDAPKKTSFGYDVPENDIHVFGTPKKTTNKTIHGFDTPRKITFGIDTPNKTDRFDIPKTTETQTKLPEELHLLENDLRNVLLQRKRKMENNSDENAKKSKAYNERQATPKKHVTFKLDTISDIDSSEDFSYEHAEMLTPPKLTVETISSLRRLGATNDPWYIAIDLDVLLEHFEYIDALIKSDPLCRLLVPYSVYKELTTISTACDSRARVNSARNILRRLDCSNTKYKVQGTIIGSEKLKSSKDQIQCCCIELIRCKIHVVLVTNNDILYKEAKEKRIHVIKMSQIQDGGPKTPDVTFDIRKIQFQIPNDSCVPNPKGKTVEDLEIQTVKRNDQNMANENHEQKTDEKYKSFVENFWRSDNSDNFDIVSQKKENLEIAEKPLFLEKIQLAPKKQFQKEVTFTTSFLKPMKNVVITKNVIQNNPASLEAELRLFDSRQEKTLENQDDSQYSIFEKSASKEIQGSRQPDFTEENQHSSFETPASKETEYCKNGINRNFIFKDLTENHNQLSILQKPASKESENHGNDNHNSIFEIDSNFMPLTSKTVEDYLKTFNIKNKMVEDSLKNSGDEKVCCLRQILEDFGNVIQVSSSKIDNSRACVLYIILQIILKIYGRHQLIRDVIEKLKILLYNSEEKMRVDLLPIEIMQAIGCGILLVQLLKELKPSEHLTDIEEGLNELIKSIENPANYEFSDNPIMLKNEKNGIYGENRINFTKDKSEIIQYLKKHYPAWTNFDETTCVKQKPEIKIYRTFGKNLNQFKLNRSRIIVEKAIENVPTNTEPNSIRFHENDRSNIGNIENNNPKVLKNEEIDKINNFCENRPKKTETSKFFDNFDIQDELKSLENPKRTEPKVVRLFSNDRGVEKNNFDPKKIEFDPKQIEFDHKKINFDPKETDSHLNHGNTFGPTESGPKVVRNIAPIPKYEDLFKKSVQSEPRAKTAQNGLQNTEISLSDTENMSNEDFLPQNPKIDSKYQKNNDIFNKEIENRDHFETSSLSVLDEDNFLDSSVNCYTISDCPSNDMIDNGIDNKTLKAAITTFFKEIKICFQNIQNFIGSSFDKIKKTENSTEVKSTAKKLHTHLLRIIEKLSAYREAEDENMNFSFLNLLEAEENSTELYITKCRHLSSLCIEQAKMLEKIVIELCNLSN